MEEEGGAQGVSLGPSQSGRCEVPGRDNCLVGRGSQRSRSALGVWLKRVAKKN